MARDKDKERSYQAEQLVFMETLYDENIGMRGVVDLGRMVLDHDWWREVTSDARPEIVPTRVEAAVSRARWGEQIRVAPGGTKVWVLAHELAHIVLQVRGGNDGHGPRWRATYVDVARLMMGEGAAKRLRTSFEERGLPLGQTTWESPTDTLPYGLYGQWRAVGVIEMERQ